MPQQTYSDFFSPASTAHNQIDQLIGELGDPGSIRAADPWWNMYGQAKESVGDWLGEMLPPSPGIEPGTPRYESAEENIKNLFGLIPQEKWELPLYALGGAGSLKKGKKLLSGAKSKKSVSDYLEKMMKRMRAEEQGADILYSNMEKGVYPRDTAKKFYSDVYPSLKPDVQKQFRHWSQTGEFYPGATKGGKAIDVPFDEQIDDYISETFPSIKSHGEDAVYDFIEGTWDNPASRGELSYMSMINDMFDAAKQGKPSSIAEFLSGTQVAKALPEKGWFDYVQDFQRTAGEAVLKHYKKSGYLKTLPEYQQKAAGHLMGYEKFKYNPEYFLAHILQRKNPPKVMGKLAFPEDVIYKKLDKSEKNLMEVIDEGIKNLEEKVTPMYQEVAKKRDLELNILKLKDLLK